MTRIDTPTLKCDRCGYTTMSLPEMGKFHKIYWSDMGGEHTDDLCPACWISYIAWTKQ